MEPQMSPEEQSRLQREERRKKILQNRESRLKVLLGEDADAQVKDIIREDDARFSSLHAEDPPMEILQSRVGAGDGVGSPSGFQFGQSPRNGSLTPPQPGLIPPRLHKIILIILALFVTIFIQHYLLLYFLLWEVLFLWSRTTSSLASKSQKLSLAFNLICMSLQWSQSTKIRLEKWILNMSQLLGDLSLFIMTSLLVVCAQNWTS